MTAGDHHNTHSDSTPGVACVACLCGTLGRLNAIGRAADQLTPSATCNSCESGGGIGCAGGANQMMLLVTMFLRQENGSGQRQLAGNKFVTTYGNQRNHAIYNAPYLEESHRMMAGMNGKAQHWWAGHLAQATLSLH